MKLSGGTVGVVENISRENFLDYYELFLSFGKMRIKVFQSLNARQMNQKRGRLRLRIMVFTLDGSLEWLEHCY